MSPPRSRSRSSRSFRRIRRSRRSCPGWGSGRRGGAGGETPAKSRLPLRRRRESRERRATRLNVTAVYRDISLREVHRPGARRDVDRRPMPSTKTTKRMTATTPMGIPIQIRPTRETTIAMTARARTSPITRGRLPGDLPRIYVSSSTTRRSSVSSRTA